VPIHLNKTLKISLISLVCIVILGFLSLYLFEKWLSSHLEDLINRKPDRAYQISFEDLDIQLFAKVGKLEKLSITPLRKDSTTYVTGTVREAKIININFFDLAIHKAALIEELHFDQPTFEVMIWQDTARHHARQTGEGLQGLFGDILSRGELKRFSLANGSVTFKKIGDSLDFATVEHLSIDVNDLQTDEKLVNYMIPFKASQILIAMGGISYQVNEYTRLYAHGFNINVAEKLLQLDSVSLTYSLDWLEVSRRINKQIDLINFTLDTLSINGLDSTSNLTSTLNIQANAIEMENLKLVDFRDKNKQRPPDDVKPLFAGMIKSIPFPIQIDSIRIKNSDITYLEVPETKTEPGAVNFANVQGTIYNLSNISEARDSLKQCEADLLADFNGSEPLQIRLVIPYNSNRFYIRAKAENFNMRSLNQTVEKMANIDISNGFIKKLDFEMQAGDPAATNTLILDYDSLHIEVLDASLEHEKGFMSGLANSLIRTHNLPDDNRYATASYTSVRNRYRGPFNFIWQSLKEGFSQIALSQTAKTLLGKKSKKEKKK